MTIRTDDVMTEQFAPLRSLGRVAGRIALPIRVKFITSFVGIAVLMIALALTGISELSKANARTAELVAKEAQISRLRNFESQVQKTILVASVLFVSIGEDKAPASTIGLTYNLKAMTDIARWNARGANEISIFTDHETSKEIFRQANQLRDLFKEVIRINSAGNLEGGKELLSFQLLPGLRTLEADLQNIAFDLRLSMNRLAETNDASYQNSKRLVAVVSSFVVLLALLLGYSISTSISRPIERVHSALLSVAEGDFSTRANITNCDEMGELVRHINQTTECLGVLYDELEAVNQHKSQFLANMSHELRTPMHSVLGYTELIQDGIYGEVPAAIVKPLARIDANGRILLSLIDEVLDFSKAEVGQLKLQIERYDLSEIANSIKDTVEPLIAEKGLEFEMTISPSLPTGKGDSGRIYQILLNLVGNAIKFTDKGSVKLNLSDADGLFQISVTDTGPGISQGDQERIFGEFQQADNSTTRATGGTGLGLSISRKLAELHGGTLSLDSKKGGGARFFVSLPVVTKAMRKEGW